ncbi:unnamed protein product [Bursaphelenchus xylophilus]|uniref:(pine wood nematode) hypothetical protein n=1 Tax=Bursaphelenchus xylophilus TaxID=6326 RepID=A0A1I7S2Y3_BURXY|nr:unnamed protein product [Bursaphelenchus xylophilus]CAG9116027.1 unnamed protein product [Bursaphelenchus xylophilus]
MPFLIIIRSVNRARLFYIALSPRLLFSAGISGVSQHSALVQPLPTFKLLFICMAAQSIRAQHRRSSYFRQSSEPGFRRVVDEEPQIVKRTQSGASLLPDWHGIAQTASNSGLYRFFKREMFNVLFSLAKDNVGPGTPVSSPASSSRDGLVATVYKQYRTRAKLLEPYRRIKNALKKMQDDYSEAKDHNIFLRYTHMQHMVHEVVLLEKQYWQLIDVPPHEVSETPNSYVLRVMTLLDEKSNVVKSGGIASLLGTTINIAEKTKDQSFYENIRAMSTDDLRRECDRLYTELYKLIRKYQNLRSVVRELTEAYQDSRYYPIMPRYYLLKNMIKRVLRAPAFSEVCHEQTE